ncbi:MAG: hypothetical protein LBU73_01635 [Helicobacteraceae bacterium]|nr:hypothetical protein [Helicobacteraceae bacterium]
MRQQRQQSVKNCQIHHQPALARKCERCGYIWTTEEKPKADKELLEYLDEIEEQTREDEDRGTRY